MDLFRDIKEPDVKTFTCIYKSESKSKNPKVFLVVESSICFSTKGGEGRNP